MKKVLLLIVTVFVLVGIIFYLANRNATPAENAIPTENNQGTSCDMALWAHVYHGRFPSAEDRLQVINPCLTVAGTIVGARAEADGDWHVQLDVDSQYRSLLNQANLEKQQGYLVLEPMCSNYVSQKDTIEEGVCGGFSQQLFDTELVGQRVTATGAYVIDMQHGWMELHPVTSIVPVQ